MYKVISGLSTVEESKVQHEEYTNVGMRCARSGDEGWRAMECATRRRSHREIWILKNTSAMDYLSTYLKIYAVLEVSERQRPAVDCGLRGGKWSTTRRDTQVRYRKGSAWRPEKASGEAKEWTRARSVLYSGKPYTRTYLRVRECAREYERVVASSSHWVKLEKWLHFVLVLDTHTGTTYICTWMISYLNLYVYWYICRSTRGTREYCITGIMKWIERRTLQIQVNDTVIRQREENEMKHRKYWREVILCRLTGAVSTRILVWCANGSQREVQVTQWYTGRSDRSSDSEALQYVHETRIYM